MSQYFQLRKWRMIIAVNFPVSKKNQGFNGIRTRDLRDTGAPVSRRSRVRILLKPWFYFQASSLQLLKLENLLRWSLFTFIYNRSTNMNYFIWTLHFQLHCKTFSKVWPNIGDRLLVAWRDIMWTPFKLTSINQLNHIRNAMSTFPMAGWFIIEST